MGEAVLRVGADGQVGPATYTLTAGPSASQDALSVAQLRPTRSLAGEEMVNVSSQRSRTWRRSP